MYVVDNQYRIERNLFFTRMSIKETSEVAFVLLRLFLMVNSPK